MLNVDPAAAHHPVDPTRLDLALEFMRAPMGRHSPELQLVLNRMRWSSAAGRHVLLVVEPGRRWMLGRLPARRGAPIERLGNSVFDSVADAERAVFRLRWEAITGQALPKMEELERIAG